MFVQVAFILAERSLFLPSLGACVLISEAVMWFCAQLYPDPSQLDAPQTQGDAVDPGNPPQPAHDDVPSGSQDGLRRRHHSRKPVVSAPTSVVHDTDPLFPRLPPHRSRILHRLQVLLGVVFTLCMAYSVRAWIRNYDWLTEEALMKSNLAIYPDNNPMSNYGLG
jgi:hypothetical protein